MHFSHVYLTPQMFELVLLFDASDLVEAFTVWSIAAYPSDKLCHRAGARKSQEKQDARKRRTARFIRQDNWNLVFHEHQHCLPKIC